jgi:CubicO group peptidase (beta-lactamase class C family)
MAADITIHGHCDEKFAKVYDAFEKNFNLDVEVGAAYTVMIDEEPVVDLWAGHRDAEHTLPWEADTIVPVASCSKVAAGFCGQLLIDRGQLELDETVGHYWPEFAQNGKEKITVRQVFSHSSGVPGFEPPLTFESMCDWQATIAKLESQAPWWEPGTQSGYHAVTFGYLVGELCARISGLPFIEFFEREVRAPLNLDFFYTVNESQEARFSAPINDEGGGPSIEPGSIAERTYKSLEEANLGDVIHTRGVVMPSGSGRSNARSLAKLGTAFATGTWRGKRFLSPETIEQVHTEQIYTEDLVMGAPVRWGLGVGLPSKEVPIPFPNSFHWGGRGGSIIVMEPDRKASEGDDRGNRLSAATIRSVTQI